jgi:hypothetical protein
MLPFNFGEYSPRTLGVTVNLPIELGERLSGIAAGLIAEPRERQEWFGQLFREGSDRAEKFLALGYASAAFHELRHFHDYLVTPVGTLDAGDYMMAAANLLPALLLLKNQKRIAVPLQAWTAMPDRLYASLRGHGREMLLRKPPELTEGYTRAVVGPATAAA